MNADLRPVPIKPVPASKGTVINAIPFPASYTGPPATARGTPAMTHTYCSPQGDILFAVCRWVDAEGKKTFMPLVWDGKKYHWKGYPEPRPPLNAVSLHAAPTAPVLVVSGEKTADAAAKYLPDGWLVTTWAHGDASVMLNDWSLLYGRRVILWPDNDHSGREAMEKLAAHLNEHDTPNATVLVPNGWPEKWDLADPLPAGSAANITAMLVMKLDDCALLPMAEADPASEPVRLNGHAVTTPEPPTTPTDEEMGLHEGLPSFLPLGHDGKGKEFIFFTTISNGTINLTRKEIQAKNGLMSLNPEIKEWHLNGTPARVAAEWEEIGRQLMKDCYHKGPFDPGKVLRGVGIWEDKGRIIAHMGREVWVNDVKVAPSQINSKWIYPYREERLALTGHEMLTRDQAGQVLAICRALRWDNPFHGDVFAGLIATAPLCGILKWRTHGLISGPRGSGKAQPHSAKILTPNGWLTMGDMKVGSLVTTPDNQYARVLQVHPQGIVPIYKITFADGRTVRATGDHLWKVRHERQWRLRTTDVLRQQFESGMKSKIEQNAIPLSSAVTIYKNAPPIHLPLHPYVMGCLLGDGHLGNKVGGKSQSITLSCKEPHIVERCRLFTEGSGFCVFDQKDGKTFRVGDLTKGRHYGPIGSRMRRLFKELQLVGMRSNEKFIPEAYLNASVPQRIELLKGLMDTDGYISERGGASFCSVSKLLATQVAYLVRSLGGTALISMKKTSFTHKGIKKAGQLAYNVNLRLPDRSMFFSLPRKVERAARSYQYEDRFYLKIRSIEPDGFEEASCITIDHPDRLYLTDDFIVTHNSWAVNSIAAACLGDFAIQVLGATSEAGIRTMLEVDARPVLFDENESGEHNKDRMEKIIELMRAASSQTGAGIAKGSADHTGRMFKLNTMFIGASIGVPFHRPSDLSRTIVMTLKGGESNDPEERLKIRAHFTKIKEMVAKLPRDLPQRLVRRMAFMAPTVVKNAELLGDLIAKHHSDARTGDQIGVVLAGMYALMSDDVLTEDKAMKRLKQIDWDVYNQPAQTREDIALMAFLSSKMVRVEGPQDMQITRTIGELCSIACNQPRPQEKLLDHQARDLLLRYGIKFRAYIGDESGFMIAKGHPWLNETFRTSDYPGSYYDIIARHPSAKRRDKGERFARFAGSQHDWVWLPAGLLNGYGDEDAVE